MISKIFGAAADHQRRCSRVSAYHLDVVEADLAESYTESLHCGFFCGKASGETRNGIESTCHVVTFSLTEDAIDKSGTLCNDRPKALDLNCIDADADHEAWSKSAWLFNGHDLCQIARAVNVVTTCAGNAVGEELEGYDIDDR